MDSEEYKDRFSSIASHGFISLGLAMGHQLGLFKALRNFKESVTSQKLADQCKLKERYVTIDDNETCVHLYVLQETKFNV